jgi:hypothetical protein
LGLNDARKFGNFMKGQFKSFVTELNKSEVGNKQETPKDTGFSQKVIQDSLSKYRGTLNSFNNFIKANYKELEAKNIPRGVLAKLSSGFEKELIDLNDKTKTPNSIQLDDNNKAVWNLYDALNRLLKKASKHNYISKRALDKDTKDAINALTKSLGPQTQKNAPRGGRAGGGGGGGRSLPKDERVKILQQYILTIGDGHYDLGTYRDDGKWGKLTAAAYEQMRNDINSMKGKVVLPALTASNLNGEIDQVLKQLEAFYADWTDGLKQRRQSGGGAAGSASGTGGADGAGAGAGAQGQGQGQGSAGTAGGEQSLVNRPKVEKLLSLLEVLRSWKDTLKSSEDFMRQASIFGKEKQYPIQATYAALDDMYKDASYLMKQSEVLSSLDENNLNIAKEILNNYANVLAGLKTNLGNKGYWELKNENFIER